LNNAGSKTRITKNAAILLKARVALFEGTWEKYHAGTALVPKGTGWPGDANYQFPSGSADGKVQFFLTEAMNAADQIASTIQLVTNSKVNRQSASEALNPYYDILLQPILRITQKYSCTEEYTDGLGTHYYNHYIYSGAQKGYTHQMEQSMLMENGLPIYATEAVMQEMTT
jgi:hypothetical protein